jgi:hypothetical protein
MDSNQRALAELETWIDGELEALGLDSELASHNKRDEIEQDITNAPSEEERATHALTAEQAKVVADYVDLKMRVKDSEAATAVRKAKVGLLREIKSKLQQLR